MPQDIRGSIAHSRNAGASKASFRRPTRRRSLSGLKHDPRRDRGRQIRVLGKARRHPHECRGAAGRVDRAGGGRLHTARSRNDQVAVDFRLWVKNELLRVAEALKGLIAAFLERAEEHAATVMPGFTHMQAAQPVTFGHHCMAYVEMFSRDLSRVRDAVERMDESPLGAAALAGTGFPIDRHMTAKALGFREPTRNSLDTVSDRDFALEFLSVAAICGYASVAAGGRDRHLVDAAIRLRETVGQLFDRLVDHAAEEKSGCGRAGAGQDRPHQRPSDRAADCDEGPAADLFQGHAGGQGSGVRRGRDARPDAGGDDRHGRRHDGGRGGDEDARPAPAIRPPPTSPTGWCARSACPSARRIM